MTNITRKLATLAGVLFVATTLGCASTAKQEGSGEYVDDTVITTQGQGGDLQRTDAQVGRDQRRDVQGRGSAERLCEFAGRGEQGG